MEYVERILASIRGLFLLTGLGMAAVSILFANTLARWVFGTSEYWFYIIIIAVALPVIAQHTVLAQVLRGMRQFKAIALSGLITVFLGVVVTVPMVLLFELDGAVISVLLSAMVGTTVHYQVTRRVVIKRHGLRQFLSLPDRRMTGELAAFGLAASASVLLANLNLLFIRSSLITVLGPAANGLYQVAFLLRRRFNSIINDPLHSYALPSLAAAGSDREARRIHNSVLRLYLTVAFPALGLIILLADIWIPLLYSREFLEARTLIPWELAGWCLGGVRGLLMVRFWVMKRFTFIVGNNVAGMILFLSFYFILLEPLGLVAVPVASLISGAIMLPVVMVVFKREALLPFTGHIWKLFLVTIAALGMILSAEVLLTGWWFRGAVIGIEIVWALISIRPHDLVRLREEYRRLRSRSGNRVVDSE